ncbi:MAG: hypothetical protein IPP33_13585 [Flavobacteriales bacterium]|nr:hypothetical protein [Flavobacteriales bacterium]
MEQQMKRIVTYWAYMSLAMGIAGAIRSLVFSGPAVHQFAVLLIALALGVIAYYLREGRRTG